MLNDLRARLNLEFKIMIKKMQIEWENYKISLR